jgi:peptide deformylase
MKLVSNKDEILATGLEPFDFESVDAVDIKKSLVDIMIKHKGVGLSANQVGLNYRCFVMGESKEAAIMVINPEIHGYGEEQDCEVEGCLSFPDVFVKITRPTSVQAKWYDEHGEEQGGILEGYGARVFMHEFDHLNGVVYRDKVSRLKWERALKKRDKIQKQRKQMVEYMHKAQAAINQAQSAQKD